MENEAGYKQKLKLMYLSKLFEDETDEQHPLTVYELIDMLGELGINATRKTLSEDIALLCDFGMEILSCQVGKAKGYYLASREFEVPELKLLADAVSSARFITEKKSRVLIKKLEALAGKYSGQDIRRSVYISNRVKSENELIYISVDIIQRAIREKKKLKFRQFDYDVRKRRKYREGERTISPYALTWSDGNYYVVGYYEKYEGLSNFRVDRMSDLSIPDEKSEKMPQDFDLTGYMNTTFSMFSAVDRDVKMRFDASLVNVVLDKFGGSAILVPEGDNAFIINTKVKPGPTFYGWIFQFGSKAEIISPPDVRREFKKMAAAVTRTYAEKRTDEK